MNYKAYTTRVQGHHQTTWMVLMSGARIKLKIKVYIAFLGKMRSV